MPTNKSTFKGSYNEKQKEITREKPQSFDKTRQNSSSKHRQSYSGSEAEDERKYEASKKLMSSSKAKKITSLFEESDEDSSNHDNRIRKDVENRKPKSFELEKPKNSLGDAKFKIPKSNPKSDPGRTRIPDNIEKVRSSDDSRTSNFTSKPDINKERSKPYPNNFKFERAQPGARPDIDKSRPTSIKEREKPRVSNESVRKESSAENVKKPTNQSAEETLKKSASVWSKPCNLPPPPAKPSSGLSESQLQRLREMNKKPTPTSTRPPPSSQLGRPSPRDERKSDGRPLPPRPGGVSGKPSLLKAAAAAAASRAAVQKPQMSTPPQEKEMRSAERQSSTRPSERQPSRPEKQPVKESSSSPNKSRELMTKDARPRQFPPSDVRPKQFPPADLKPKQFPPSDLKPRSFPPKDVRGRQFPPADVKRKPKPRRIDDDDDSEDEYDSEMDDFIDDGTDMNQEQISREIQSIFGYDKSRYDGLDDDDECMESNFGQIDREEYISLRIGAEEDYKELMKEMAEKKRKRLRKLEMMRSKKR